MSSPSPEPAMRGQILAAATRLFARRGFAATSIQAVADAVGIRKQSLLYHFSSKAALRDQVLRSLIEHWRDVIPPALARATSGENRFEALTHVLMDFFREDKNRALFLIRELLDRPKESRGTIGKEIAPWVGVISNYIRKGQESGELRADVDAEAYILETILFTISTVVAGEVLLGLMTGDEITGQKRIQNELHRMTKVALFANVPARVSDPNDASEPIDNAAQRILAQQGERSHGQLLYG